MRPFALLFVFVVVGPLAAGGAGKDGAQKDLDKLQGTWDVVRVEEGGKPLPAEMTKGWTLTIKGDRYKFRPGDKSIEGTYKRDPGHTLKWIDATRTDGADKGKTLLGIYELQGDELKMCFSAPGAEKRPREFATGENGGQRLYILKRAKS